MEAAQKRIRSSLPAFMVARLSDLKEKESRTLRELFSAIATVAIN